MPTPVKAHKYRDLIKKLVAHDPRFQFFKPTGGGSHHQIYHPDVGGKAASYPVPFHGEHREVKRGHLAELPANFFDYLCNGSLSSSGS